MHLRTIVNHLVAIGEAVFDWYLILYVIGVLDSSYNHFVSFFIMNLDDVSFDQFHNQLLTYERNLDQQHSLDVNEVIQENLAKFTNLSFENSSKKIYI